MKIAVLYQNIGIGIYFRLDKDSNKLYKKTFKGAAVEVIEINGQLKETLNLIKLRPLDMVVQENIWKYL